MKKVEDSLDEGRSLDEVIEAHLQALLVKLARPHTIEKVEADLAALNDLIYSYKRRDELLEKLLDSSTSDDKRRQIKAALQAQKVKVAENRAEMERLHAKSHQLMERSILLIQQAQKEIHKQAHLHSGYWLEVCGECKGMGTGTDQQCEACNGKGKLLVPSKAR